MLTDLPAPPAQRESQVFYFHFCGYSKYSSKKLGMASVRKGFELQFQIPTHHFWEVEAGSQAAKRVTSAINAVCCFAQLAVFSPTVQDPAHEVVPPLTFTLGLPTFN